jgi:signal transduction histidine kinase
LQISEAERRRIGQDLHDTLGQHLTGVALLGQSVADRLAAASAPEVANAAQLVAMVVAKVNDAIRMTRELARGLLPPAIEEHGFSVALEKWANEVGQLFRVDCRLECSHPVCDGATAGHLYRLIQEAVNNAIRHGGARRITIAITAARRRGTLTVADDGSGFDPLAQVSSGLGLRIMQDRARAIGGKLQVASSSNGGTTVRCSFPLR